MTDPTTDIVHDGPPASVAPTLTRRTFVGGAALGAMGAAVPVSTRLAVAGNTGIVVDGEAAFVVVPREEPDLGGGVEVEAEAGTVTEPMRVVDDPSASDGSYLDTPPESPNNLGSVTVSVIAPVTADYTIWIRMWGPDHASDSWNVTVDNGTAFAWTTTKVSQDWVCSRSAPAAKGLPRSCRTDIHSPRGPTRSPSGHVSPARGSTRSG